MSHLMGYLICRITSDGRNCLERFVGRAALGEPRTDQIRALAQKHGYEIRPVFGKYKREQWPVSLVAYVSRRKDGVGRVGGTIHSYPARTVLKE